MTKTQKIKTGLLIVFGCFIFNTGYSQSQDEGWSEWKEDELFEDLKIRTRIVNENEQTKIFNIQCVNSFPHKLDFILVVQAPGEKPKTLKVNLGYNKTADIKMKLGQNPIPEVKTVRTSLAAKFPDGFFANQKSKK